MASCAAALLQQCREVISAMETKRETLAREVTRKTLYIEQCRDNDLPPSQRLILPEDVIDLSDLDATELQWCGTSGLKITLISGLEHLHKVELVSFRSGFIRQPSCLTHLSGTLRVLELYENRLRTLRGVETLVNLEILDVSYNRLGKLESEVLKPLTKLKRFYCAENKLQEIPICGVFAAMKELEILDLGGNLLRKIEGLENLPKLRELWLGKNKIERIENLNGLDSLVRISLQSNRIIKMENLNHLRTLEELYLSDQGIGAIEGIDELVELNTLDFTNNRITSLANFPTTLHKLTDLWLAANRIESFRDVELLASNTKMPLLDTLVFERNPEVEKEPNYRARVKELFPTLTYIDANPCV